MSNAHLLSQNELKALLRRTLEALYFQSYDYEDMAQQILWLEMHGLGGVQMLVDALPSLERNGIPNFEAVSHRGNTMFIDAQGNSLIGLAEIITDLTIGRAKTSGWSSVLVENCHSAKAILPNLCRAAKRGLYASAQWSAVSGNILGEGKIASGLHIPDVRIVEIDDAELTNVRFICTLANNTSKDEVAMIDNQTLPTEVPASILQESYDAHLTNGIAMDQAVYDALALVADRVLVEATEESRSGAGE